MRFVSSTGWRKKKEKEKKKKKKMGKLLLQMKSTKVQYPRR